LERTQHIFDLDTVRYAITGEEWER
jgi:hypothetical protein